MSTGYGALCTDFYVNQKLSVRMDLPSDREAILGLFDRVRKVRPNMSVLKRFDGELALESPESDHSYEWLALRRTSIRSGCVNPASVEVALAVHRALLETAPYYLTISALEVASLEVLFGFDFEAETNRNDLVFEALFENTPLGHLVQRGAEEVTDCQPGLSFSLEPGGRLEASIDIKTRVRDSEVESGQYQAGPISVTCAVRRYGAVEAIDQLPSLVTELGSRVEHLVDERVLPRLIMPLREMISSRPG